MKSAIKVLFLAARPTGMPTLTLDREVRDIGARIRASRHPESLLLVSRWAVRAEDLAQALMEEQPHIVHFAGHGEPEGILVEGQDGRPHPISPQAMTTLFQTLKDNVRLVVFNACFSKPQALAVTRVIDSAIGVHGIIKDRAAITFAAAFYRALGFGRSLQAAFDLGLVELQLEGLGGENGPELILRDGVDASRLVLIRGEAASLTAAEINDLDGLNFVEAKTQIPQLVAVYGAEPIVAQLDRLLRDAHDPNHRAVLSYGLGLTASPTARRLLEGIRASEKEYPNVRHEAELALERFRMFDA